MNWTSVIDLLFGGVGVGGLITAIYYRKANKAIKEEEAKKAASETKQSESAAEQADIETQRQEIELADLYKHKVLDMMELLNAKQDKGNLNQDKILDKLNTINNRVDKLEINYSNLERWANGDFHSWLAKHEKGEQDDE